MLKKFHSFVDSIVMDRRHDPRRDADLPALLTDLANPARIAPGRIVNLSKSGVCIELEEEFPLEATVKLQQSDCVMFGHVIYNRREGITVRVGVEVVRVLIGESDLARLFNRVLLEAMPATPGVARR